MSDIPNKSQPQENVDIQLVNVTKIEPLSQSFHRLITPKRQQIKVKEIKSATGEYALVAALQETPKASTY